MIYGVAVCLKLGGTEYLAVVAQNQSHASEIAHEMFDGNVESVAVEDLESVLVDHYDGAAVLGTGGA